DRGRHPLDARGRVRRPARRRGHPRRLPALLMDEADRELYERAVAISKNAYAPYSNFLVGAVLRARDGTLFDGVNVENAAYPLGVCGEKSAYVAAVTAGYKPGDFDLIAITASPCGGCRQ